jgi:phosphate uptake regulator
LSLWLPTGGPPYGALMRAVAATINDLDEAVERLRRLALVCGTGTPEAARVEAVRARVASYALAARDLERAGVSPERQADLIERGWLEAETVSGPFTLRSPSQASDVTSPS